MKIINVPIENLEERYSTQWNNNFPEEFKQRKIEFIDIHPKESIGTIERGQFLDYISTNYFKAKQLAQIYELFEKDIIKDRDVFFFHDLWFPGIEGLFYIRDASKIKFKIVGMLHAGTYDPHDYLTQCGMKRWAKNIEQAWFNNGFDKIFVATNFHKELLMNTRLTPSYKIAVTGFPLWDIAAITEPTNSIKYNRVVFPHRLAQEKQPHLFDEMETRAVNGLGECRYEFIKTKNVAKTKYEYFHILERSKVAVSFALQETWGIAMQEAVFRDCIPLVPDRLSYREMYDDIFKYKTTVQAYSKLKDFMDNYDEIVSSRTFQENKFQLKLAQASALHNMLDEIKSLIQ